MSLSLPGHSSPLYAAKRFFNVGQPKGDSVSCVDNASNLALEAERLATGRVFLKEFYSRADQYGAEVARGVYYYIFAFCTGKLH